MSKTEFIIYFSITLMVVGFILSVIYSFVDSKSDSKEKDLRLCFQELTAVSVDIQDAQHMLKLLQQEKLSLIYVNQLVLISQFSSHLQLVLKLVKETTTKSSFLLQDRLPIFMNQPVTVVANASVTARLTLSQVY